MRTSSFLSFCLLYCEAILIKLHSLVAFSIIRLDWGMSVLLTHNGRRIGESAYNSSVFVGRRRILKAAVGRSKQREEQQPWRNFAWHSARSSNSRITATIALQPVKATGLACRRFLGTNCLVHPIRNGGVVWCTVGVKRQTPTQIWEKKKKTGQSATLSVR